MIRYRLASVLGEGGGGIVYRALDLLTGIEVAVSTSTAAGTAPR